MVMRPKLYILITALTAFSMLSGCGPKPKVEFEPVSAEELRQPPLNPVAFYHYTNGVIAELEENYELALSYYRTALSHEPDSYDIRVALANLYLGMREYDEAWKVLKPLDNRFSEAVLLKADAHRGLGDWQEAIKYYRIVEKLDPTEIAPHWYLGNYYKQTGQFEKAVSQYEKMTALSNNPQVYNELVQLYLTVGDSTRAMKTYETSLAIDPGPENRDAYMGYADLLLNKGEIDSAITMVTRFLDQSPRDLETRFKLIELYITTERDDDAIYEIQSVAENYPNRSQILGRLGLLALDANQIEMAKQFFTELAEMNPNNFLAQYYLGRIAQFNQDFELAKERFYNVIDMADTIPDGWINLAEVYRVQDSLDMAVDILKQGMSRVKTGREDMRLFLSRYYSAQERYEAVVNILDGLIDSETDDVPTLFTLGSALERVGQVDSSIAVFERLLKLQPKFHPALNYLGYMLADQGIRLREAKQMIEDALAQDSLNPAYLDSYGWVLFKMGDLDEAEKYIRKALEQMQNDVVIWDHLAEIYYARGLREQAREMWEKALALDPDNATIREKLDR